MASIIKIKRSTGTSAPSSLKSGELAYSYGAGTAGNGGDRLYFGKGDDGNGNATSIVQIGGEWYKNLLDHTAGQLSASSAIITDASSKIDQLNIDNLTLDGNTISSTNTNGDIVLDPNGSGKIDVSNAKISNLGTPTTGTDAATKAYVDQVSGAALFTVNGDTGTDTVNLQDSELTLAGAGGISTTVTDNNVEIRLDSTNVTAGTYGSANEIPVFTVDAQGRLDSAGTVSIATNITLSDGTNTDTYNTGETLTFTGTAPINTAVTDNNITISASAATTSTKGVASFSSTNFNVVEGAVSLKDSSVANSQLVNSKIGLNGQTINLGDSVNLTTDNIDEGASRQYYTDARARGAVSANDNGGDGSFSYSSATGVFTYTGPSATETRAHFSGGTGVSITDGQIAIGQSVGTTDSVTFGSLTVTGNTVVNGNLQVNGTQTIISSQSLAIEDAMIYLNQLESDGSPTISVDVGFAANVNDTGTYAHTGFFRDATDGVWKLYDGYTPEPDSDLDIDTNHPSFNYANLRVGNLTVETINGGYAGFDSDFANQNTDALTEGDSNRYYTRSRVDSDFTDLLDAGTGISITNTPFSHSIAANIATTTSLGIASFNTTNFAVNSGAVTSKNITFTTGDTNTKTFTLGGSVNLNGSSSEGITTSTTAGNLVIGAVAASTAQRGTAQFDSNQFGVVNGLASINQIDGGTY